MRAYRLGYVVATPRSKRRRVSVSVWFSHARFACLTRAELFIPLTSSTTNLNPPADASEDGDQLSVP